MLRTAHDRGDAERHVSWFDGLVRLSVSECNHINLISPIEVATGTSETMNGVQPCRKKSVKASSAKIPTVSETV